MSCHSVLNQSGKLDFSNEELPLITLTLFGDFALYDKVSEKAKIDGTQSLFDGVKHQLVDNSINICNLESVIVNCPEYKSSDRALLVSDTTMLEALKSINCHIATFANNHVKDYGDKGLVECLDNVRAANILICGSGKNSIEARRPAIITREGINIVVFSYADSRGQIAKKNKPGCAESRLGDILEDVAPYTNRANTFVLVSLHMDAEFQQTPSPMRIELCRKLSEAGVDIVFCHHPHVPQGVERWGNSLIAYSLGNYITPLSTYLKTYSNECHKSFHLVVRLNFEGIVDAEIVPVIIDEDGCPHIANREDKAEILALVAERSDTLQDSNSINNNYKIMTTNWVKKTASTVFWAIRNGDLNIVKCTFLDFLRSKVKRQWLFYAITGRLY